MRQKRKKLALGLCALAFTVSPLTLQDFTVKDAEAFEVKKRGGFKLFGNSKSSKYKSAPKSTSSSSAANTKSNNNYVKKSSSAKNSSQVWDNYSNPIRNSGTIPKKPVPEASKPSNFAKQPAQTANLPATRTASPRNTGSTATGNTAAGSRQTTGAASNTNATSGSSNLGASNNGSQYKLYREKGGRYSHNQYYSRQSNFYNRRGRTHPNYAYRSYPSFGIFDALFLWWMLDSLTGESEAAEVAYHNQDNPDMQQFLGEAGALASEYPEIGENLAILDAKMAEMKGIPIDPNYVPKNIDPAVMLAAGAAIATDDNPKIRIGTGGASGNYFAFCNGVNNVGGLKHHVSKKFEVECINTGGSVDNLNGLMDGDFDAILVQSDVVDRWMREQSSERIAELNGRSVTLYPEYIHMITNEAADVDSVTDLDPNQHHIYLMGSGAAMSWEGLGRQDNFYASFQKVRNIESDVATLNQLAGDPNAIGVYVSGLKNSILEEANAQYGEQLSIVPVDDWDFNNAKDQKGDSIYMFANVPSNTYPNLQDNGFFGFTQNIETLTVKAKLMVSQNWLDRYDAKTQKQFEEAILKTMPYIERKVGL